MALHLLKLWRIPTSNLGGGMQSVAAGGSLHTIAQTDAGSPAPNSYLLDPVQPAADSKIGPPLQIR